MPDSGPETDSGTLISYLLLSRDYDYKNWELCGGSVSPSSFDRIDKGRQGVYQVTSQ